MSAQELIAQHLDIWTAAHKTRSTAGRGSNNKLDLVGIKKLRELILELAVRGKLVPQDPNDEPASKLLKDIASEKEHLIKTGLLKKDRYVDESETLQVDFDLPAGWEIATLGTISTQITDGTHHTPTYIESGIPFISVKDIDGHRISFEDCKYISPEQHKEINARCNPEFGDILICRIGTLGRVTIVDTKSPFSIFVSVGLIKFFQNKYTSRFAHLVLGSPLLTNQYQVIKAGGSHTNKLNLGDLPRLILPVAPLPEQHRIVAKVDELMVFCDQLEQTQSDNISAHAQLVEALLATLTNSSDHNELQNNWQRIAAHFDTLFTTEHSIDQLKQTILQLAVMGKLVPQNPNDEPASELLKKITAEKAQLIKEGKIKKEKPLPEITDEEKPFELPSGWEWAKLGGLAEFQKGYAFKSEEYLDSGQMITKIQNLTENSIENSVYIARDRASEFEQYLLLEGDIVMTTVGSWFSAPLSAVGRSFLINRLFDNSLLNQNAVRLRFSKGLNPIYILTHLKSLIFKSYLMQEAQGTANQASITQESIKNTLIGIPPTDEQHRIVAKVDELMTLCDTLKTNLLNAQTTQLALADALVEQAVG